MKSRQSRVQRYLKQYQTLENRKKRRKPMSLPVKLLLGVFITAVGVYFAVQLYQAVNQPLKTVTAMETTVYDELSATGYFVRSESPILQNYSGILQYVVNEGQKLSQGELFANVYQDSSAAEQTAEIEDLNERIQTLQTALDYSLESGNTSVSTENLSEDIQTLLLSINTLSDARAYAQLSDSVEALKEHIINRDFAFSSSADVEAIIASLTSRRDRLEAGFQERERGLYTSVAGFFSTAVDGYESFLTPNLLDTMTVADYEAVDNMTPEVSPKAVGKIVTDFNWYFVTTLRQEDASRIAVGQQLSIHVDAVGDADIQVRVSAIRPGDGTESLVIFESSGELSQIIGLRRQTIRILLNTYQGLKVPKDALRVDENYHMGVYVITGMYAEFKQIEPVYETEEYYIVKTDPTTTKSLLVYDEIIVSGRGLENKKVIA